MERVHQVCSYLRKYEASMSDKPVGTEWRCKECPAKQKTKYGQGAQMCRLMAQEMLNIAETGSPWRTSKPWPPVKGNR